MGVSEVKGNRFLTTILIAVLVSGTCASQSADEQRLIFTEAESHYLFGEYELANPLYLILNEFMPGNANIKFKIGNRDRKSVV